MTKKIVDPKLEETFNLQMGEQTRMELTEAEAEFLKVLDDEMEQKGLTSKIREEN